MTADAIHPRAAKLQKLADVLDLETGEVRPDAFLWERAVYDDAVVQKRSWRYTDRYRLGAALELDGVKQYPTPMSKTVAMRRVNRRLRSCSKCKGLNVPYETESCCPWGWYDAAIAVVGQSAHKYAVRSDLPFILQSGFYLDAACYLSDIKRDELLIYNTVACHPARNRASLESWKESCRPYLREVLSIVEPELVVCLGNDAIYSVEKVWKGKRLNMTHPAAFMHSSGGSDAIIDWVVKLSDAMDKVLVTERK